ncbi:hypothetical protein, partial [Escherichia coli]|uniref:hypothetical protein n=1 Tax=Escherichia coli TaxID=562 RepID=UPI0013D28D60
TDESSIALAMGSGPMQVLADGVVRALGQGVVAVVADSREAARDALELVSLDVEEVPAATLE